MTTPKSSPPIGSHPRKNSQKNDRTEVEDSRKFSYPNFANLPDIRSDAHSKTVPPQVEQLPPQYLNEYLNYQNWISHQSNESLSLKGAEIKENVKLNREFEIRERERKREEESYKQLENERHHYYHQQLSAYESGLHYESAKDIDKQKHYHHHLAYRYPVDTYAHNQTVSQPVTHERLTSQSATHTRTTIHPAIQPASHFSRHPTSPSIASHLPAESHNMLDYGHGDRQVIENPPYFHHDTHEPSNSSRAATESLPSSDEALPSNKTRKQAFPNDEDEIGNFTSFLVTKKTKKAQKPKKVNVCTHCGTSFTPYFRKSPVDGKR
eukprot:Awhi_evm1s4320